ncbi:MAG TPA: MraY family glycosyltransferase [bacterium]|nr:MraY family glycosyltransferase [bacterium]
MTKELIRSYIFVFVFTLLLTFFITPIIKYIVEKKRLFDLPFSKRKIHRRPIGRLGGIAFAFSFLLAMIITYLFNAKFNSAITFERFQGFIVGLLTIVLLGVVDDIYDLPAIFKLIFQILIGMMLYYFNFTTEVITNPISGETIAVPPLLNLIFTILWTVAIMNAINLIDGLDGLAASLSIIASFTLFIFAINRANIDIVSSFICLALAGSLTGFIKYNLPPAEIFMGDCGSLFIGYVLAVIGLIGFNKSSTAMTLLIPIASLTIPISDTIIAIIRRSMRKKRIFDADKEHIHHRLLNIGLSDRQVLIILIIISLYFSIISLLMINLSKQASLILFILMLISIIILLSFLKKIEIRFYLKKKSSNNGQ